MFHLKVHVAATMVKGVICLTLGHAVQQWVVFVEPGYSNDIISLIDS